MIESAEMFVALRTSDDPDEYWRAAHDSADIEVWHEVIDSYPDMRQWVAHNKTSPLEILRLLARDPDPLVRYTVASARRIDDPLMRLLAQDEDDSVRAEIARHPKIAADLLGELCSDESWVVSDAAKEALERRSAKES